MPRTVSSSTSGIITGIAPAATSVRMYRWLITHEGGISADTPPRLWRVWVGTPTMGRPEWCGRDMEINAAEVAIGYEVLVDDSRSGPVIARRADRDPRRLEMRRCAIASRRAGTGDGQRGLGTRDS